MDDYPSYHFPSHPCLMMHCKVLVNWATHTSFHIILILIKTVYSMWKFCSFVPISLSSLVITKLSGSMGKNRFADVSRITLHLIYTLLVYPQCFFELIFYDLSSIQRFRISCPCRKYVMFECQRCQPVRLNKQDYTFHIDSPL